MDLSRIHSLLTLALHEATGPAEAGAALLGLRRTLAANNISVTDLTVLRAAAPRPVAAFQPAGKLQQRIAALEAEVAELTSKNKAMAITADRLTAENRALTGRLGSTKTELKLTRSANRKLNNKLPEDQRRDATVPQGNDRVITDAAPVKRQIFEVLLAHPDGVTDNRVCEILNAIHDATVRSTRAKMVADGFVEVVGSVQETAALSRAHSAAPQERRTVTVAAHRAIGTLEEFDAAVRRGAERKAADKAARKVKAAAAVAEPIDWTDERRARVQALVNTGLSSADIARIMTGEIGQPVTENAIKGQRNQAGSWKTRRTARAEATAA